MISVMKIKRISKRFAISAFGSDGSKATTRPDSVIKHKPQKAMKLKTVATICQVSLLSERILSGKCFEKM